MVRLADPQFLLLSRLKRTHSTIRTYGLRNCPTRPASTAAAATVAPRFCSSQSWGVSQPAWFVCQYGYNQERQEHHDESQSRDDAEGEGGEKEGHAGGPQRRHYSEDPADEARSGTVPQRQAPTEGKTGCDGGCSVDCQEQCYARMGNRGSVWEEQFTEEMRGAWYGREQLFVWERGLRNGMPQKDETAMPGPCQDQFLFVVAGYVCAAA